MILTKHNSTGLNLNLGDRFNLETENHQECEKESSDEEISKSDNYTVSDQ